MKILLVSINSVYEQTGGGIYLRTLKSLYEMSGAQVDVFSKDSPDYKIRKIYLLILWDVSYCAHLI